MRDNALIEVGWLLYVTCDPAIQGDEWVYLWQPGPDGRFGLNTARLFQGDPVLVIGEPNEVMFPLCLTAKGVGRVSPRYLSKDVSTR